MALPTRALTSALLLFLSLLLTSPVALAADDIRAIYLFKDVMKSNTTSLQKSGFNTLIIFGIGVLSNGDIMYYSNTPGSQDVLVASGGSYVGGPALAEKVRSLKTDPSSGVTRLEICMNSQNIRNLMSYPGPGANTNLYRNFAALREAWLLDAVNNDDEHLYDLPSTVTFARMLGQIGYRYTTAPYDPYVAQFWISLVAQANQGRSAAQGPLLDRTYLQCYDGGANNNPPGWANALGMKVVPLLWVINDSKPVFGVTPAQARARFAQWKQQGGIAGAGYWNDYDIEKMGLSYREYGQVLKDLFPS
ncbi:hypothetical protein VTJ49DRAFT_2506 [Mycothermus thermophilus]|uniref:Coagulation factor 5/8 type domain-containing protein n=1 Tax=Humicola insolens TaxID=85995 RepID=A0ABR3VA27_HUMIN